MSYIAVATIAYLLFAINGVIDKFLLSKAVKHPIAYAFYIGITGPLTWVFAPFGLKFLGFQDLLIAILAGASFIVALYFLYVATKITSISRLLPIEGGLVPFFTLVFAYWFLDERLSDTQALGFLLVSLILLVPKKSRQYIFNTPKETSTGNKYLYYGARVSGGVAGLLQNYAISIGSVTIVNAMQVTQYAFLLILTLFLSRYFPSVLKEKASGPILLQKILAIVLISCGLIVLQ